MQENRKKWCYNYNLNYTLLMTYYWMVCIKRKKLQEGNKPTVWQTYKSTRTSRPMRIRVGPRYPRTRTFASSMWIWGGLMAGLCRTRICRAEGNGPLEPVSWCSQNRLPFIRVLIVLWKSDLEQAMISTFKILTSKERRLQGVRSQTLTNFHKWFSGDSDTLTYRELILSLIDVKNNLRLTGILGASSLSCLALIPIDQ